MNQTEKELIQGCKKGNQKAFYDLVQRYESQIRSIITGMLGNVTTVNEVAQDVFIRFFRSMDSFRGDSAIGTFLSRIAINLSLNELKRRKREQQRFRSIESHDIQISANNGNGADILAAKDVVYKALQQLNEKDRALVLLRMLQGYSVKDTAKIMNIPQGSVASGLARAQQKIKSIIIELNTYEER